MDLFMEIHPSTFWMDQIRGRLHLESPRHHSNRSLVTVPSYKIYMCTHFTPPLRTLEAAIIFLCCALSLLVSADQLSPV